MIKLINIKNKGRNKRETLINFKLIRLISTKFLR